MKVGRDAFLYMDPQQPANAFGQCATCEMFLFKAGRCAIHGPDVPVSGGSSCGLYVHGNPVPSGTPEARVTPQESGLVTRPVRCENCRFFTAPNICRLYMALNQMAPNTFALDPAVHPKGCCNAQMP